MSAATFASLWRATMRVPGNGQRLISASLIHANESAAIAPSQTGEPRVAALVDPLNENAAVTAERGDTGPDGYLPASVLTERPQVLRDIEPEWHFPGVLLPNLVALLLINEYGDVDRVLLDQASLSPMLEEDLRLRFLAMRFTPGRLHDRPVKSALRIEIRLD